MPLPEGKAWVWPIQVQAVIEAEFPDDTKLNFSKFFRSGPVACGYVSSETKDAMPEGTHRFAVFPEEDYYVGPVLLEYRKKDLAELTRICGESW